MGVIKVGTSSWADQSLLRSGWYPRSASTPARRLGFYASQFPMVEVDTSYYAIPVPETTQGWVDATPDDSPSTSRRSASDRSPDTVRRAAPGPATGQRSERIPRPDLPSRRRRLWARPRAPSTRSRRRQARVVMLQFPPWLVRSPPAQRRIVELASAAGRGGSLSSCGTAPGWTTTPRRTLWTCYAPTTCLVCVDMPQGHPSSVPPILTMTAEPAIVRFTVTATPGEGDKQEKFRYAYAEDELRHWAGQLAEFADIPDELHVPLNDCCPGRPNATQPGSRNCSPRRWSSTGHPVDRLIAAPATRSDAGRLRTVVPGCAGGLGRLADVRVVGKPALGRIGWAPGPAIVVGRLDGAEAVSSRGSTDPRKTGASFAAPSLGTAVSSLPRPSASRCQCPARRRRSRRRCPRLRRLRLQPVMSPLRPLSAVMASPLLVPPPGGNVRPRAGTARRVQRRHRRHAATRGTRHRSGARVGPTGAPPSRWRPDAGRPDVSVRPSPSSHIPLLRPILVVLLEPPVVHERDWGVPRNTRPGSLLTMYAVTTTRVPVRQPESPTGAAPSAAATSPRWTGVW